jgi:hypothetical protein
MIFMTDEANESRMHKTAYNSIPKTLPTKHWILESGMGIS